jgi:hypothetical protein
MSINLSIESFDSNLRCLRFPLGQKPQADCPEDLTMLRDIFISAQINRVHLKSLKAYSP